LKCLVKRNIKIAGTDSGTAAYDLSEIVQDVAFKYNIYILFESAREFLKKKKKKKKKSTQGIQETLVFHTFHAEEEFRGDLTWARVGVFYFYFFYLNVVMQVHEV
jgi:hypothetical protein